MKPNVGVPNSMHVAAMMQPWEDDLTGQDVGDLLAVADAFGFDKCMLSEHFVIPHEHVGLSGDHYFHVVALGYIGGRTNSSRLSSSVEVMRRFRDRIGDADACTPVITHYGLGQDKIDFYSAGIADLFYAGAQ